MTMSGRISDVNALPVSAAVKALNPGVFGGGEALVPTAPQRETLSEKQGGISYKPRLRQDRKGPNKTEAEFEAWLKAEWKGAAFIHAQGFTLTLANGVRYTPDFVVVIWREELVTDGSQVMAFETKGFMRDDAAVKVKVAARLFPWIKFHLVTKKRKKDGGGWAIEEVLP